MELVVSSWMALYAAPLLVLAAAFVWWRSPVILSRRAKQIYFITRAVVLVLLCLALADIKVLDSGTKRAGRRAVFLVDVSESIGQSERSRAIAEAARSIAGPCQEAEIAAQIVLFNGKSLTISEEDSIEDALVVTRSSEIVDGAGTTDLGIALNQSLAQIPEQADGRIIVFSDGRFNGADIDGAIQTARLRSIRIDAIALQARKTDGVTVENFSVPDKVFILEKFPIEALIHSREGGQVRVRLQRNGVPLASELLELRAGLTRWEYSVREERVGRAKYSFRVDPLLVDDEFIQNNSQVATVRAETVPRILVVTDTEQAVVPFVAALEEAGIKYRVILEGDFPHGLAGMLQYSAIVFNDVAADEMRSAQLEHIREYVRDHGGGFIMMGGKKSFGMGGYSETPVEAVLPVHMTPQRYATSFALILLLDASSSMSGFPIQWVKRAAKQIIWLMRGKYLGVYFFNTLPKVAVRLQRIERNRILVEQDIDSIRSFGGTAFSPALKQAMMDLRGKRFTHKHIILLSDGNPADTPGVKQLYGAVRAAGIKVSTIGIGTRVNTYLLQDIATNCDGRFYASAEVHRIPEIFEEEVKRIIGPPYVEKAFWPIPETHDRLLRGFTFKSIPKLYGYVGTTLKKRAQLALSSESGDVVLAHWRFGLGKTAVFTSDVTSRWGKDWVPWNQSSKFWGRVVKSVLKTHSGDFVLNVNVRERKAELVIDAVDAHGDYIDGVKLRALICDPSGNEAASIRLGQTGQGRYQGSFILDTKGFYDITVVREVDGKQPDGIASGVVALGYSPEYRFLPTRCKVS